MPTFFAACPSALYAAAPCRAYVCPVCGPRKFAALRGVIIDNAITWSRTYEHWGCRLIFGDWSYALKRIRRWVRRAEVDAEVLVFRASPDRAYLWVWWSGDEDGPPMPLDRPEDPGAAVGAQVGQARLDAWTQPCGGEQPAERIRLIGGARKTTKQITMAIHDLLSWPCPYSRQEV